MIHPSTPGAGDREGGEPLAKTLGGAARLPKDISRCAGHQAGNHQVACARRDTCLRFLAPVDVHAWYIHPQIPGPCIYFLEAPQALRSAERAEGPLPATPEVTP